MASLMKSAGNCPAKRSCEPSWCGYPHWAKGIAPESNQQSITSGTRRIRLPGGLGRIVGHGVDIRLVDAQVVGQARVRPLGLFPDFDARDARLGQQFFVGADGLHVAGLFADPDRQRRAPVALAREGPIDVDSRKLPKRPSRMCSGSQWMRLLLASMWSRNCVVRMNQLFRGYWISGSSSARQQNG